MQKTPQTRVSVLLPLAVPAPYDYLAPDTMAVQLGDIVRVPLRQRDVNGVVWKLHKNSAAETPARKLKHILARYDVPPLAQDMREFLDWVAAYVMAPTGAVLRQTLTVPDALVPPKPINGYRLGASLKAIRMTPARLRVFEVLKKNDAMVARHLAERAAVSMAVIRGLEKSGHLEKIAMPAPDDFPQKKIKARAVTLSPQQAQVADDLVQAVRAREFSTHLLDGVTGSGKTEVYFEAIAAALAAGRQALILLPEIALTAQFLSRFEARFGCAAVLWHSGLSAATRRRNWRGVASGAVRVLVGARSALFLPWHALGAIVVDEEHDGGYKQEEGVIYHARDMAVVRARFAECAVILASATPSLESIVNARNGKYRHHSLPARYGTARLPEIRAIDMRIDKPESGKWLAPALVEGVAEALARGEQALLFLNRRGYAPLTLCRACGHRYACRQCDAWLVAHKFRKQLLCHHCGATQPIPTRCDACDAVGELTACGPGVERVTEEARARFPDARCVILSSDHIDDAQALRARIDAITRGDAELIIGTQIIAKGHHFPLLSYVGVVDADLGLGNGDLRAAERSFQMLYQVAGRAGREARLGRVDLQTMMPDHPVLEALVSGDRDAFLARESAAREAVAMPPFGRLAAVIVSGAEARQTMEFAQTLARQIPRHNAITVLGPAPAPIARLRNRYRYRFLLRAPRRVSVQSYLADWLARCPPRGTLRVRVDIDPISFM